MDQKKNGNMLILHDVPFFPSSGPHNKQPGQQIRYKFPFFFYNKLTRAEHEIVVSVSTIV